MSQYTHLAQDDQQASMQSVLVPTDDQTHQQSHGVGGDGVSTGNEVGATGFNLASAQRVFLSPAGVLRLLELLFSIVAFGTMSDQSGYSDESSFGFLVFVGVVSFLYIIFILVADLIDLHSRFSWLYLVEFGLDVLFALFAISAGIAVAYHCNQEITDPVHNTEFTLCSIDRYKKSRASAAFSFLLGISMAISTYYSYKRYRNPPRGGNLAL